MNKIFTLFNSLLTNIRFATNAVIQKTNDTKPAINENGYE